MLLLIFMLFKQKKQKPGLYCQQIENTFGFNPERFCQQIEEKGY